MKFISIFQTAGAYRRRARFPGIFGHRAGEEGINPHASMGRRGRARKSVEQARKLLADAGYPGWRDPQTGQPLLVHLEPRPRASAPIAPRLVCEAVRENRRSLVVRATDYNRFQDKSAKATCSSIPGLDADYPTPRISCSPARAQGK